MRQSKGDEEEKSKGGEDEGEKWLRGGAIKGEERRGERVTESVCIGKDRDKKGMS